jgi:hypothetical protein
MADAPFRRDETATKIHLLAYSMENGALIKATDLLHSGLLYQLLVA